MDNNAGFDALSEGLSGLGIALPEDRIRLLLRFRDELLKWNQKVNLTAITQPREVLEKHFVDSLAVLGELGGARTVLDVGAGAGFPGIPLKIARPELEVTLVDTVGKKVAFMKNAIAALRLFPGAKAVHARAEGSPEREALPRVDLAVSRAFTDVRDWVPLAAKYLAPGGRVLAMLGQMPSEAVLQGAAASAGLRVLSSRAYQLPWTRAGRAVAVFGAE